MASLSAPAPAPASSSMLWATASKEWVIPSKPKPGRKPKKDAVQPAVEEVDAKGRRVQNRAAQRAFRERKQSQLAELQARVQSYEQGEIERNVALQNVAKRLKQDNEALKRENSSLKETVARLQRERDAFQASQLDRKRCRDDSPSGSTSSRKKSRIIEDAADSPGSVSLTRISVSAEPSSPSMVSTPETLDTTDSPFSPVHIDPHTDSGLPNLMDYSSQKLGFSSTSFSSFNCGFCSDGTPCVCREVGLQQVSGELKLESFDPSPGIISLDPQSEVSILDNLPAYQPPVPLRRKSGSSPVKPVFEVTPVSNTTDSDSPASCSGDPNNCAACANDSFGKAFCEAIGKSVSTAQPYADQGAVALKQKSAGNVEETMPTDAAWKQLKSHPNVEFSDLSLLADVVARRSKCTGPRVLLSPAPELHAQTIRPSGGSNTQLESQSVLLTDPHAPYHESQKRRSSPGLQLVPQDILVKAGQEKRVREVNAAGVQEALRLLDAKFS